MNKKIKLNNIAISFAGGGFYGMCYYFGVLNFFYNNITLNNCHSLGASAGSWAATALIFQHKINLIEIKSNFYNLMDNLQIPYFKFIDKWFDKTFKNIISDTDIHTFSKFIHISVTEYSRFTYKNYMINHFQTFNQLKQILLYSSNIPFIFSKKYKFIDGGFTNNQPIHNKLKTIRINPIYSYNADIFPSKWFNPYHIFNPVPLHKRIQYFNNGYEDTYIYFHKNYDVNAKIV